MGEMSSLERVIYQLLVQSNISFQQEKIFKDCYSGCYRYDFYMDSRKIAIEVNGIQHYQLVEKFYKNRSDFLKSQERDRRKIAYCLANNITLYIIPYWEIENIKKLDDLFKEKYIAHDKFHNDKIWNQYKHST